MNLPRLYVACFYVIICNSDMLYLVDSDYRMRLRLWPGSKIKTFGNIRPFHGADTVRNYTSGTVYLSDSWHAIMRETSKFNLEYVVSKWGCDLKRSLTSHYLQNCTFSAPFGNASNSIRVWSVNSQRIQHYRNKFIAIAET